MFSARLQALLSRLGKALAAALLFALLATLWVCVLAVLFRASGLRAWFQGGDDFAIAALTIIFVTLMSPVPIVHRRIMARVFPRSGGKASAIAGGADKH